MATIFAPQVRTIQPAFEYSEIGGVAKIYFSLSSFNTLEDIDSVSIIITNPRVSASAAAYMVLSQSFSSNSWVAADTEEYYIRVTLPGSKLALDQYYQVQLIFNKDSTQSEPSQVSLIKPIPTIDTFVVTLNPKTREVYGEIKYTTESNEAISTYSIRLIEDGISASYPSKVIDNNNYGTSFSTVLDYYLKEGSTYIVEITYTTINGFSKTISSKDTSVEKEAATAWSDATVLLSDDENGGGIHIEISSNLAIGGKIRIQRASDISSFRAWETVTTFTIDQAFIQGYTVSWTDYFVEGGRIYQYRVYFDAKNETKYLSEGHYYSPTFGDIFISTTERQLAIRYNPNISGFKWITQESITNTLGGKYPLIRRNAQTKYRQFNLSGTIYVDPSDIFQDALDSRGHNMSTWMDDTQSSLFLNQSEIYDFDQEIKQIEPYIMNEKIYEKKFREMAMAFLTDGKVKMFRSFQEGNMIVYLSNVSFTPNKQLDRRIYDFSATVTELCEATAENMKKYRIHKPMTAYRYVLKVLGDNGRVEYEFSPTISIDKLFNNNTFIVEYEELVGV